VDTFIFEIAFDEKDDQKRNKLTALRLTEAEWGRIDLFQVRTALSRYCSSG
jgi:hypothetical protein